MEPKAAQRNRSDGSFAVCCSILRAIGPSRCCLLGSVSGVSCTRLSGKVIDSFQSGGRNNTYGTHSSLFRHTV
jgi:hypothetical protein